MTIKLCRFRKRSGEVGLGLIALDGVRDVTSAVGRDITALFQGAEVTDFIRAATNVKGELVEGAEILAPLENQEVWAAGVTYLRSKKARMEESDFSASAYDKVYEAERPEIFFKALGSKVVGPKEAVGIRADARWNVPEPELALVINAHGGILGYTICNDMSSRDIEGENLLYLPQAKIYDRSCAVGPCIVLGASENEARTWEISLRIERAGAVVFAGDTSAGQIKRRFDDLVAFLYRSQTFPLGVILSTGTGIIPPDAFTLQEKDRISIHISGIGTLENHVKIV